MSNSNFKSAAQDAADAIKEDARDAMNTAAEMGASLRDDAAAKVRQGADAAVEQGQKIAENVRDFANRQSAAGSRIIDSVTASVSDLADNVTSGQFGDVLADAKAMVQRNPMAFLIGAAVVGYLAGRSLRSDD